VRVTGADTLVSSSLRDELRFYRDVSGDLSIFNIHIFTF
jgi:hypothetical protein